MTFMLVYCCFTIKIAPQAKIFGHYVCVSFEKHVFRVRNCLISQVGHEIWEGISVGFRVFGGNFWGGIIFGRVCLGGNFPPRFKIPPQSGGGRMKTLGLSTL